MVAMVATIKGGDKLTAKLQEIANNLATAKTVKVGFLGDAYYPDGTSVAFVAAQNEYGVHYKKQPPRPFFRIMINDHKAEWGPELKAVLKDNDYNAQLSLEIMGQSISDELKQSILDLTDPPLAPYTIAKKGFDKPLIDTGTMLNSLEKKGYEVS